MSVPRSIAARNRKPKVGTGGWLTNQSPRLIFSVMMTKRSARP
jgi:hypothetical protein